MERSTHRGAANGDVMATREVVRQLVDGRIRGLVDERANLLQTLVVDLGRDPAAMRPRIDAAGRSLEIEIILHGVRSNREPLRQIAYRSFPIVVSLNNPPAQFAPIRAHVRPLTGSMRLLYQKR